VKEIKYRRAKPDVQAINRMVTKGTGRSHIKKCNYTHPQQSNVLLTYATYFYASIQNKLEIQALSNQTKSALIIDR